MSSHFLFSAVFISMADYAGPEYAPFESDDYSSESYPERGELLL